MIELLLSVEAATRLFVCVCVCVCVCAFLARLARWFTRMSWPEFFERSSWPTNRLDAPGHTHTLKLGNIIYGPAERLLSLAKPVEFNLVLLYAHTSNETHCSSCNGGH
jgi:hypothetical protein